MFDEFDFYDNPPPAAELAGYGGSLDTKRYAVSQEILNLVDALARRYPNAKARIDKWDTRFPNGAWLIARQSPKGVKWLFVQALYQGDAWFAWLFDSKRSWLENELPQKYIDGTDPAIIEDVLARVPGEFSSTGASSGHTDGAALRAALSLTPHGALALRAHDGVKQAWPADYQRLFASGENVKLLKWCIATAYTATGGLASEIHPRNYAKFIAPNFAQWANQANEPMMDLMTGAANLRRTDASPHGNAPATPQQQVQQNANAAMTALGQQGPQGQFQGTATPFTGAQQGLSVEPANATPAVAQTDTVGEKSSAVRIFGLSPLAAGGAAIAVLIGGALLWRAIRPASPQSAVVNP